MLFLSLLTYYFCSSTSQIRGIFDQVPLLPSLGISISSIVNENKLERSFHLSFPIVFENHRFLVFQFVFNFDQKGPVWRTNCANGH